MKTQNDLCEFMANFFASDFMRLSFLGLEMIVLAINMIYDGRC